MCFLKIAKMVPNLQQQKQQRFCGFKKSSICFLGIFPYPPKRIWGYLYMGYLQTGGRLERLAEMIVLLLCGGSDKSRPVEG